MVILLIQILVFFILIILSAFFSGSETALTSIGKIKARQIIHRNGDTKVHLDQWLQDPSKLLTTILVGNNIVNICASVLGHIITEQIMENYLHLSSNVATVGGVAVALVTLWLLVFGEVTPKIYCRQNAEKIVPQVIHILNFLYYPLFPIIWILRKISHIIVLFMGGDFVLESSILTEEDLKRFLEASEREGLIEEEEREMIDSIFDFGDTIIREVMVPRVEMNCLEINTPLEVTVQFVVSSGHSRIPVYNESVDNIVGIVYSKDILKSLAQKQEIKIEDSSQEEDKTSSGEEKPLLEEILHPPHYVPENKKVSELLEYFQSEKIHMAMVVDEYGGISGLVTLEDVLEEIVGEIHDEFDAEPPQWKKLDDGSYLIDARMELEHLDEELDIVLPDQGEYETVGGFISHELGKIPVAGEFVEADGYKFTVESADERHITEVIITKLPKVEEKEEES